ncbi:hypothetical protein ACQ4M4_01625 [Leptolyngbya sp. AN02str]|uniref:hypothetical protein n=1 Tax=Leptolyngbya sp. AN02str TaxID=3423363 RepID=UPI003D312593
MTPNPEIMRAVEALQYRVTAGDVAAKVGLDIKLAEQGLLALASEAGGHMQVAESGDVAFVFPRQFRSILQSKYVRLRLQAWWNQVWRVLFYIIRISFGIALVASLILIVLAILAIYIALMTANRDGDNDSIGDRNGGILFLPRLWFGMDWYYIFLPDYSPRRYKPGAGGKDGELSFLESVFSFLFGDGNPNADLDERRWGAIATVIRNNRGAVVAEQIAPYLDIADGSTSQEYEDYMLPILTRFNGSPEVSDDGQLIYRFPELQVSAKQQQAKSVPAYLKENLWKFSKASSGQLTLAGSLGAANLVGAVWLGFLLRDGFAASLGGIVGFVGGIYGLLLAYGLGFIGIPLLRYLWIQRRNQKIEARNVQRQDRAILLNEANSALQHKLNFARQFATESIVGEDNLAYDSQRELTEQELERKDAIDNEWYRRLEGL